VTEHAAEQREALRQQQLLRTLWRRSADSNLTGWLRESGARAGQGIAAYRGNAAAIAERALAAAYPTVQQLLGDESFVQLARVFWHRHPPQCGDLAWYGAELPTWIADDAQLASEPYLADVARIDWAVHRIEQAADVASTADGLPLLVNYDPARLRLRLRPGLALLPSRFPVVTIWQAHRSAEVDRFAPVRAAFQRGERETALVSRAGWRAEVEAIDDASSRFIEAVQRGANLGLALDTAGEAFAFDRWLQRALAQQWLQSIEVLDSEAEGVHR
jgi:hypothetical protein